MAYRSQFSRTKAPDYKSSGITWTSRMVILHQRLPEGSVERQHAECLFRILSQHGGDAKTAPRTREVLSYVFGLDEGAIDIRSLNQVATKLHTGSEEDTLQAISVMLEECHRAGLPPEATYGTIRKMLRNPDPRNGYRQPSAPPVPNSPTPPSEGPLVKLVSAEKALLRLAPEDQRELLRALFTQLEGAPTSHQQLAVYLYGLDDQSFQPRSFGAVVDRLRLKNEALVQDRLEQLWRETQSHSRLGSQINDRWFRALLSSVVLRRQGKPAVASRLETPGEGITPPTASPRQEAAPTGFEPRPVRGQRMVARPAAESDYELPTNEDRDHFLALCPGPVRECLRSIYDLMPSVPPLVATLFTRQFGLRRGQPPMRGAEVASSMGWSDPTHVSRRIAIVWDQLDVGSRKGTWLRPLMSRLHETPYPPEASKPVASPPVVPLFSDGTSQEPERPTESADTVDEAPDPAPLPIPQPTEVAQEAPLVAPARKPQWTEATEYLSGQRKFLIWLSKQPLRIQAIVRAYYFGIGQACPNTLREIAIIFELPGGEGEVRSVLDGTRKKFQDYLDRGSPISNRKGD